MWDEGAAFFRWLNQWRQAPRGMRRLPLFSLERYFKVTARIRKAEGPDGPTCRGPLPRPASANWEDGRGVRRAPLVRTIGWPRVWRPSSSPRFTLFDRAAL
jgi:hypothetical protein